MGAFGSGFLQAIGQAAHQKAADARAQENKIKDEEAKFQLDALQAWINKGGEVDQATGQPVPWTDDQIKARMQKTFNDIAKLQGGSKSAKEIYQKVQQIAGQITKHPLWGRSGSDSTPQASQMGAGATPSGSGAPTAQPSTPAAPTATPAVPPPPGMAAKAPSISAAQNMPQPDASAAPAASPTSALTSPSPAGDGKSAPQTDPNTPAVPADAPPPKTAPNGIVPPPPSARTMATDTTDPTKIIASQMPPGAMADSAPAPARTPAVPPPPSTPSTSAESTQLSPYIGLPYADVVKLKSANAGRQAAFEQRKQQLDDWEKVHGPLPDAARQEFLFGIKNPTGTDTWKPEEIRLSDGSTVSALFDAKTAKWKYLNGGPIPDELLAGAKSAGSPESDYQKSLSDYRQKALALAQAKFDASKDPKNPQTKAALLRAQNDALKSEAYMIRAQAGAFGTYNGKALPGAMLDNEGNPVGSIFAPNVRPTSTQRERATLATSAKDQMKDMESILTDRNDLFGPVSGHGTNFTQWLGTTDPDAQRFKAAARVTADHLAGVFGGRSQYALESIYDVIGKNTTNPEAAIAALEQMMKAADIIQEQGIVNTVGGNPSSPKGKVTPKVPPPPRSGANPDTTKPKHSLAKAMALPFNKGKTEAQVRADLESHGYEVIP